MTNNEHKPQKVDIKQANTLIAVVSLIGLVVCFVVATFKTAQIPLFLYAIFGGGVLGTDSVLKFIKAIFRIDNDEK